MAEPREIITQQELHDLITDAVKEHKSWTDKAPTTEEVMRFIQGRRPRFVGRDRVELALRTHPKIKCVWDFR